MNNIKEQLVSTTKEVHKKLHVHPMLKNLLSPKIQATYYISALCAFQNFYLSLSKEIISSGFKAPDTISKSLDCLDQDLIVLHAVNAHKPCLIETQLNTRDALYGLLYVVEGSQLGGQLIAKNIRTSLKLTNESGASFFHGRGKDTAKYWMEFLKKLEDVVLDHDQCAAAALSVFEDLERHLWLLWRSERPRQKTLSGTSNTQEERFYL